MAKFRNLHGVLRARPSSPNGPEGEQAILRLAVFATITSYAWFPASFATLPMPERERILLMGTAPGTPARSVCLVRQIAV